MASSMFCRDSGLASYSNPRNPCKVDRGHLALPGFYSRTADSSEYLKEYNSRPHAIKGPRLAFLTSSWEGLWRAERDMGRVERSYCLRIIWSFLAGNWEKVTD